MRTAVATDHAVQDCWFSRRKDVLTDPKRARTVTQDMRSLSGGREDRQVCVSSGLNPFTRHPRKAPAVGALVEYAIRGVRIERDDGV